MSAYLANFLFSFFLLPYILIFKKKSKLSLLESLVFGFAASVGLGTLFLFYLILFLPQLFTGTFLFIFFSIIFSLGAFLWLKKNPPRKIMLPKLKIHLSWENYLWALIAIFFLYVLIDSFFVPIFEWDVLARYAYWGHRIFILKQFDNFEAHYPFLIPLSLAYSFLMSNNYYDYPAKLIPALFSIGTVLATYLLASKMFGKIIGSLASFFLICITTFVFWSTRVYTDIPQTFYLLLFILSLYCFCETKKFSYALLAGIFITGALWTRQSAIIVYISCLLLIIALKINTIFPVLDKKIAIKVRDFWPIVILPLVFVGYYYLRNYLISGVWIYHPPVPIERTIKSMFPFISEPSLFNSFLSPILFVGLFIGFFQMIQSGKGSKNGITIPFGLMGLGLFVLFALNVILHSMMARPYGQFSRYLIFVLPILGLFCLASRKKQAKIIINWKLAFLFWFVLPYYFIIWLDYSWEARFWVVLAPFFSIFAAKVFYELIQKYLTEKLSQLLVLTILFLLFLPTSFRFVGILFQIDPKVSDTKKKEGNMGGGYEAALFLNNLPKNKVLLTHDGRVAAYAPLLTYANQQPQTFNEIKSYDYFLVSPWTNFAYKTHATLDNEVITSLEDPKYFEKLFESKDKKYILYRILK